MFDCKCRHRRHLLPASAGIFLSAYRAMRKLQHQLRLHGQDARIDPQLVTRHAVAVTALWQSILETRPGGL
jgi:glutamate-ammonia-ligase adenylyltransferase